MRAAIALAAWLSLVVAASAAAQGLPGAAHCDPSPEAAAADRADLDETLTRAMVGLVEDFAFDARAKAALAPVLKDPSLKEAERAAAKRLASALASDPLAAALQLAESVEIQEMGQQAIEPLPTGDEILEHLAEGQREPRDPGPGDGLLQSWAGFNPATCNRFDLRIPVLTRRVVAVLAHLDDLDRAFIGPVSPAIFGRDWTEPSEETYGPPKTGDFFSQCQDTRLRSATTTWPARTLASFSRDGEGSSCTGTLVGPRHVVTAGHCVYLNSWNDFHVIPGRDGPNWPYGSTFMSDTEGLNMGFRWYWVPAAALAGQVPDWYSGLDIAFLILPQPLGLNTGWMGMAARNQSDLATIHSRNLGYPSQPGSPIGFHPEQFEGALYGDINPCHIGNFSNVDSDGWARLAGHSCDNTSGHSGSPIFHWLLDTSLNTLVPVVSLIVSHMPAFANDFDCANNPYPYFATRVVPAYNEAYAFFRSWVAQ